MLSASSNGFGVTTEDEYDEKVPAVNNSENSLGPHIKAHEHRSRTLQDEYDYDIWIYGYAPQRFSEHC